MNAGILSMYAVKINVKECKWMKKERKNSHVNNKMLVLLTKIVILLMEIKMDFMSGDVLSLLSHTHTHTQHK